MAKREQVGVACVLRWMEALMKLMRTEAILKLTRGGRGGESMGCLRRMNSHRDLPWLPNAWVLLQIAPGKRREGKGMAMLGGDTRRRQRGTSCTGLAQVWQTCKGSCGRSHLS
jgi:hypothetical protein